MNLNFLFSHKVDLIGDLEKCKNLCSLYLSYSEAITEHHNKIATMKKDLEDCAKILELHSQKSSTLSSKLLTVKNHIDYSLEGLNKGYFDQVKSGLDKVIQEISTLKNEPKLIELIERFTLYKKYSENLHGHMINKNTELLDQMDVVLNHYSKQMSKHSLSSASISKELFVIVSYLNASLVQLKKADFKQFSEGLKLVISKVAILEKHSILEKDSENELLKAA